MWVGFGRPTPPGPVPGPHRDINSQKISRKQSITVMASARTTSPRRRSRTGTLLSLGLALMVVSVGSSSVVHAAPTSFVPSSQSAGTPPEPAPDESTPADPAPAGSAPIEVVQSWTLAPASDGQGGGRPYLEYQVAPGTSVSDEVVVYNFSNVPMQFRIYATDAFNNDDGQFDLLPGDQIPTKAGSWVRLAQESITLPPGTQATIPVVITIPLDAAPGDHAGAIVAASIATTDNGDGQVINVERRTGTRLYLQVAGPLTPVLAITGVETGYPRAINPFSAPLEVRFTVENRGNVRLGGVPEVTVSGPLGLGKRTVELAPMPELLPGESTEVVGTVGAPALLFLTTKVEIDPIGSAALGDIATTSGTDRVFAPPVLLLLLALAALLSFLAVRAYRRHAPEPVAEAPLDDVDVEVRV